MNKLQYFFTEAALELKRARGALSVQKSAGGNTEKQAKRVANAMAEIQAIKQSPAYLEAAKKRDEEKRQMKRNRDNKRRACMTEEEKEKEKKAARDRARIRRENGAYREWMDKPETKELRKKLKEKYRRQAGAIPRKMIAERTAKKRLINKEQVEAKKKNKEKFVIEFVGPPTPSSAMSEAEYYKWRTWNDADFYCKELDRAQTRKAKTRPGYRDSIVKWTDMPAAMKQAKHALYLVARQLEERA